MDAFDYVMVSIIGVFSLVMAIGTIMYLPSYPVAGPQGVPGPTGYSVKQAQAQQAMPEGLQANGVYCPNKLVCR